MRRELAEVGGQKLRRIESLWCGGCEGMCPQLTPAGNHQAPILRPVPPFAVLRDRVTPGRGIRMHVTATQMTIADLCEQMERGAILVNRDYQRSGKVWPPAARSYLLDTILLGYPVPKISLYQRLDITTRRTLKELVDGQQRCQAILDFFQGKLRISGKSDFAGKLFGQLDDEAKQQFLNYAMGIDLFVNATEREIREAFRRMNSYTVPLNDQERRHATYQGQFKWFIADLTSSYGGTLKDIGVFNGRQLSRMDDSEFLCEVAYTRLHGTESASQKKLDRLYEEHDANFEGDPLRSGIVAAMDCLLRWRPIHNTAITRQYTIYSLVVALLHLGSPVPGVAELDDVPSGRLAPDDVVLAGLTALGEALERPDDNARFAPFVESCAEATNRKRQREVRLVWMLRALTGELSV